jgi:hypothetical protein
MAAGDVQNTKRQMQNRNVTLQTGTGESANYGFSAGKLCQAPRLGQAGMEAEP